MGGAREISGEGVWTRILKLRALPVAMRRDDARRTSASATGGLSQEFTGLPDLRESPTERGAAFLPALAQPAPHSAGCR